MSTVKYTDDCATISSAVLSEVLRYVPAIKPTHPPPIVATSTVFFQPLGSSLPQMGRQKPSMRFSLTQRLLGLLSSITHQYNSNLTARIIYGGTGNSYARVIVPLTWPEGIDSDCGCGKNAPIHHSYFCVSTAPSYVHVYYMKRSLGRILDWRRGEPLIRYRTLFERAGRHEFFNPFAGPAIPTGDVQPTSEQVLTNDLGGPRRMIPIGDTSANCQYRSSLDI